MPSSFKGTDLYEAELNVPCLCLGRRQSPKDGLFCGALAPLLPLHDVFLDFCFWPSVRILDQIADAVSVDAGSRQGECEQGLTVHRLAYQSHLGSAQGVLISLDLHLLRVPSLVQSSFPPPKANFLVRRIPARTGVSGMA